MVLYCWIVPTSRPSDLVPGNAKKTKSMICQPISTEAYQRRWTCKGTCSSWKERNRLWQKERITCPLCNKELAVGSLPGHLQRHGLSGKLQLYMEPTSYTPTLHTATFCGAQLPLPCPVPGCLGRAKSPLELQKHSRSCHVQDTLINTDDGSVPLPRCLKCDLFNNSAHHVDLKDYRQGEAQRQRTAWIHARGGQWCAKF